MTKSKKKKRQSWVRYSSGRQTFSRRSGLRYETEDMPGRSYGRSRSSTFDPGGGGQWRAVRRHAEEQGAACQALYDQIDALRKQARRGGNSCNANKLNAAIQAAFTGPCKVARKKFRALKQTCAPTGL